MYPDIIFYLIAICFSLALGYVIGFSRKKIEQKKEKSSKSIQQLASELEDLADNSAHPKEVLNDKRFEQGVTLLRADNLSNEELVDYCFAGNWIIGMMAAHILTTKDDASDVVEKILKNINSAAQWPLYMRLKVLSKHAKVATFAPILSVIPQWWLDQPFTITTLEEYMRERSISAEALSFDSSINECNDEQFEIIDKFLKQIDKTLSIPLIKELDLARSQKVNIPFLRSIGQLWSCSIEGNPVTRTQVFDEYISEMKQTLTESKPRSILLVGESGVGKTALRHLFAEQLFADNWKVIETTGANLIAGKKYIGEIEGQVKKLIENARISKKIVIYIDNLLELANSGATDLSPESVLDQLWGEIESNHIFLVSELTLEAFATLKRSYPTLQVIMKVITIKAATEKQALLLGEKFLQQFDSTITQSQATSVVSDALQLSSQYLAHKALPGRLINLLALGVLRVQQGALQRQHLLEALSELSGLPHSVLDEKAKLDLQGIRDLFTSRIVGQNEAVDCLVERIAMLKAGLNDPSRPVGVFLFAGPTGTGKTEIAKTLSNILFGSEEQMIRLDMSEYQDMQSAQRLLEAGEYSRVQVDSLVNMVRKQPFSVILLDEFEKACSEVWDLFLQVFDDGRLTDTLGNAVDFRHTIIILTSNLGATINNEAGMGFTGAAGKFSNSDVMRTINRVFRREFINRLDKVVVFHALSRDTMRKILENELKKAMNRRGIRSKSWAIEWEDSAIEFLLSKGFTPDLGARPLRRAVDQYLLAPLSITIVENRTPEGDQFLFIRSSGEDLQVEFIDPDAGNDDDKGLDYTEDKDYSSLSTTNLLLQATGTALEREFLRDQVHSVIENIQSTEFQSKKTDFLNRLNAKGFWDCENRFDVLNQIEKMDRVESAAKVLVPLAERLAHVAAGERLTRQVAQKLYVLQHGVEDVKSNRPSSILLSIKFVGKDANHPFANDAMSKIATMYQNWSRARRMHLTILTPPDGKEKIFSIGGFGSHAILNKESGLHIFEVPKTESGYERIRLRVTIADHLLTHDQKNNNLIKQARDVVNSIKFRNNSIVRRYREIPSPLVRDDVYGWRSGRIDLVWAGNFDVLSDSEN